MKISCQSCQAKYTIADEKVLGKIVKIRCKKCGATIVINGSETEGATQAYDANAQQAAPAAGYDYAASGAGDSWTVNVADGDQRTMTTAEIVASYRSNVVTDETFCWKEGMGDWLPIREISDLMTALGGPAAHEHVPQDHSEDATAIGNSPAAAQQQQPGFSSLFGGGGNVGSSNGSPLFGGGDPAPVAAPAAARRAGGRGGGGADLFGSAAAAGGEEDVMTSAAANPQMAPGSAKTGERNENSVLFSLNALTQSAPKDEPKTTAQGDGSGLIDIRALGQSMAKDTGQRSNKVDDIMNLSGGGAFSAALAAPVLAPPPSDMPEMHGGQQQQSKNNAGLIIGIIGGFAVLGIIVVAALFVLKKPDNIAPLPSASIANTAPTDTTPTTATLSATVATNDPVPTATAPGTGGPKPPNVGVSNNTGRVPTGGVNNSTTTTSNPTTAATNPATATPAGGGRCHCPAGDFNCQMAEGAGAPCPGAGGNTVAAPTGGSSPFDRGQAASALGGIASNLSSCKKGDGPTGSGHVKVTFAPNGSVKSVDVDTPPFSGTSVGGCVAGKFRGAKVPAFSGGEVTVGKSFSLN